MFEGGAGVSVADGVGLRREEAPQGIVKGVIGADVAGEDERATVHARAPNGDVEVRRESWSPNAAASSGGNGEAFPRWVASTAS